MRERLLLPYCDQLVLDGQAKPRFVPHHLVRQLPSFRPPLPTLYLTVHRDSSSDFEKEQASQLCHTEISRMAAQGEEKARASLPSLLSLLPSFLICSGRIHPDLSSSHLFLVVRAQAPLPVSFPSFTNASLPRRGRGRFLSRPFLAPSFASPGTYSPASSPLSHSRMLFVSGGASLSRVTRSVAVRRRSVGSPAPSPQLSPSAKPPSPSTQFKLVRTLLLPSFSRLAHLPFYSFPSSHLSRATRFRSRRSRSRSSPSARHHQPRRFRRLLWVSSRS